MSVFYRLILLVLMSSALSGCSFSLFGFGWGDDEKDASDSSLEGGLPSELIKKESLDEEIDIDIDNQVSIENMELKQARIWSRLDELEGVLLRQKEKIRILEKGLLLGISPEKVAETKPEKEHPNQQMLRPTVRSLNIMPDEIKPNIQEQEKSKEEEKKHIESVYQSRLIASRELFRKGKYGKAYLEFSRLGREFEASVHKSEPEYWTGRCWYQLKEYQQARQYLGRYVAQAGAGGTHLAAARFWLAKTELSLGMKENAVVMLRELIKKHPYDGSTEAARQLLSHMTEDL